MSQMGRMSLMGLCPVARKKSVALFSFAATSYQLLLTRYYSFTPKREVIFAWALSDLRAFVCHIF